MQTGILVVTRILTVQYYSFVYYDYNFGVQLVTGSILFYPPTANIFDPMRLTANVRVKAPIQIPKDR